MNNVVEFLLFRCITLLAISLSYKGNIRLGGFLAWLSFHVLRIRRRVTLDNLKHAFPEKTDSERKRIAGGAYRNFGIVFLQMLWASSATEDQLKEAVRVPDRSLPDRMLGSGDGFILLSGHFGGWELLVHSLRLHFGRPFTIIVQQQRNPYVNRFIDRSRSRHGNRTVGREMIREALQTLRAGGILAVLADQSGPRESLYLNFFGRPAATHRGVAAFALRTGCPILFTALIRQPDGRYAAVFEEVSKEELPPDPEEAVRELTARHVALLERHIREHPDQWLWTHKRWKHRETVTPAAVGLQ
jgi:KDO2-lipid IV(A) lauroyltransferase